MEHFRTFLQIAPTESNVTDSVETSCIIDATEDADEAAYEQLEPVAECSQQMQNKRVQNKRKRPAETASSVDKVITY